MGEPVPAKSSTRASTSPRRPIASKADIEEAVTVAWRSATDGLNEYLAPEDAPDLWASTPRDDERIAKPVAAMVARRVPEDMRGGGDIADVIKLAIGMAVYLGRQLDTWLDARRARKAVPPAPADRGAEPEPA